MKTVSLIATSLLVLLLCLIGVARPSQPVDPTVSGSESLSSGAELYSRNCARCHGSDGRARGFKARAVHARDLTVAEWQERASDERIFNSISNGKGKMPAYGKKLSEAEINDLVNYVRGLKK